MKFRKLFDPTTYVRYLQGISTFIRVCAVVATTVFGKKKHVFYFTVRDIFLLQLASFYSSHHEAQFVVYLYDYLLRLLLT
jgi:hypothetical protein